MTSQLLLQTQPVFTQQAIRNIDQQALQHYPLMPRAARTLMDKVATISDPATPLLCLVGRGNNGADALLVAKLASQRGRLVWVLIDPQFKQRNRALFETCRGLPINWLPLTLASWRKVCQQPYQWLVLDGILGLGFKGQLAAPLIALMEAINTSCFEVVAVDIPSGLDSLTGLPKPVAIRADYCVSLVAAKLGLLQAADWVGQLTLEDLGCAQFYTSQKPIAYWLQGLNLAVRAKDSHKGQWGKLLINGAEKGMLGAVKIAAQAAFRLAGCGQVVIDPEHRAEAQAFFQDLPEVMIKCHQKFSATTFSAQLIGPGLGTSSWAVESWRRASQRPIPTLIDADALNLLASHSLADDLPPTRILTPHPAEAARLLGITTEQVQANRYQAVRKLVKRYQAVVILKGAGTLIADGKQVFVLNVADANLSVAGMGDCLAGCVAGFLSSGLSAMDAALAGAWYHAEAGLKQSQRKGRGVLPSDLTAI